MLKFGIAGRYKFIRRDADLNPIQESAWMENIITNQGLDYLGDTGFLNYCRVGSGNATPLATDTSLQTSIAATDNRVSSSTDFSSSSPYWSSYIQTWRFDVGTAAGNLSEVGIFADSSATSCGSRALIVDEEGDPTTITVLSNEILDVAYEIRTYMLETDVTGTATIGSADYDWTARGSLVAAGSQYALGSSGANSQALVIPCSGAIAAITSEPTGQGTGVLSTINSYVTGTYKRSYAVTFDLDSNNFDWESLIINFITPYGPIFQLGLDPVFEKTNTKQVTLQIELSWARYAP